MPNTKKLEGHRQCKEKKTLKSHIFIIILRMMKISMKQVQATIKNNIERTKRIPEK